MNEKRIRMLQGMPIFGAVRDDILEFLVKDSAEISLSAGQYLFREGDLGDAMFVLEQGSVAILKRFDDINYRINNLKAGDCIGEMGLIDLGPRSASVLALTDCEALALTNASLLNVYEKDLEQFALIQMNMSRELSRRLRIANENLYQELLRSEKIPKL